MVAWIARIDRAYANQLATKDCGTCKGRGEIVVAKDMRLDTYDLGPCYCVTRKLELLSPVAGVERYRSYVAALGRALKKAG